MTIHNPNVFTDMDTVVLRPEDTLFLGQTISARERLYDRGIHFADATKADVYAHLLQAEMTPEDGITVGTSPLKSPGAGKLVFFTIGLIADAYSRFRPNQGPVLSKEARLGTRIASLHAKLEILGLDEGLLPENPFADEFEDYRRSTNPR